MTGFVTTSLTREHNRGEFHCGVDALDRYLRELAPQDVKRRVAGCSVALNDSDDTGLLYTRGDKRPVRCFARKSDETVAAVPHHSRNVAGTARGRVQTSRQGVWSCTRRRPLIRTDSFEIGAFALIVDAKDTRAIGFYEAIGFALIPGETRRLFLPMATALQSFAPEKKSRE